MLTWVDDTACVKDEMSGDMESVFVKDQQSYVLQSCWHTEFLFFFFLENN